MDDGAQMFCASLDHLGMFGERGGHRRLGRAPRTSEPIKEEEKVRPLRETAKVRTSEPLRETVTVRTLEP